MLLTVVNVGCTSAQHTLVDDLLPDLLPHDSQRSDFLNEEDHIGVETGKLSYKIQIKVIS